MHLWKVHALLYATSIGIVVRFNILVMNYSFDDENIDELRVGDTLTLEDGIVHEAVADTFGHCSYLECFLDEKCGVYDFHFKKISHE